MPVLIGVIIALVVAIAALVFSLYTLICLIRDRVPYIATPNWVISWVAEHAELRPGAVVYDIGCGDGRVLRSIARLHPGIRAIGIERNWWPYLVGRLRSRGTGVTIQRGDFYRADFHAADVIYCYLLTSVMERVGRTIRPQLKQGAIVFSYAFHIPGWEPERVIQNPERPGGSHLFMYRT